MTTTRLDLPIGGMSCAACASRIEKGLQSLPGVEEAQVNFATEKATLHYDPSVVTLEQICKKVEDLGYQVIREKVTIPIGGMHCASCAANVERALRRVQGVIEAQVNFGTETATVEYFPTQVEITTLRQA
ncbi:MAG: heavy-metal-associated domain-containing protein, partial [Nitrospinota bacterium]